MAYIERWASDDWIPSAARLGILAQDRLVDADLPEPIAQALETAFVADDSGFLAYSLRSDGKMDVYRSVAGRDWSKTDTVGDDPGEPYDVQGVYTDEGSVIASTGRAWWTPTEDGAWEWRSEPRFETDEGFPFIRLASGRLFAHVGDGPFRVEDPGYEPDTIWYQPTGGDLIPIDVSELTDLAVDDGVHANGMGAISSNTFYNAFLDGDDGVRELWIITFEDLPA
jgi:hypothetical protein